ncbi:hypothetical protein SAY87_029304 [Trapa incisa]|uniref:UBA domain-containing protein n=1 Tax=Trapa incisa TaxID=236973 RepID=A0AAN7QCZ1_9MYRT|nr:hypothetical protein SAY87_029304 [Trapa incisa]
MASLSHRVKLLQQGFVVHQKLNCPHASYSMQTDFQAAVETITQVKTLALVPFTRKANTPPQELHVSDCLSCLRPGDHIEIQWRKSEEFPYGWWYGVVEHLESSSENGTHCSCLQNDPPKPECNATWRSIPFEQKIEQQSQSHSKRSFRREKELRGRRTEDFQSFHQTQRGERVRARCVVREEKLRTFAGIRAVSSASGKMNGGPSGFNNAPVTRAFVVASAIFTVFLGIQGRSAKLGLSYQDIFQKFQLWKLLASVLTFSSTPELMFGLYLLYYFRVFERQIGSNKYSVFIAFSMLFSIFLEVIALALLKDSSAKFTSGPYGLVFASFIPFYFDIPVSTRFRVFGIPFTNKSFIYLAGLQLLLSSWRRSIIPGICGSIAGSLYRMNIFYIRKAKIPEFISSFFAQLSWSSTSPPPAPTGNIPANMPSHVNRPVQRNYASVASTIDPPEGSIATLVSMGFDRDSARQALVQARNDVNAATNILLEANPTD